jgi:tRNA pseudouridine55 synthase
VTGHNGLVLLDKKPGLTSFESLGKIKKAFATKKAGHTGTLDKFASGLLLVLVGRGVKLAPLFANCGKEYIGTVFFGAETDTLDPEGEVIARGKIPSREEVEAVLGGFRGDILQAPPAYSAVHIEGRRAYELAREGKEPEMKKRPVTVHELEILSWSPPEAVLAARVSAGTYIRSLARDIALAAGSCAHLSALKRSAVGAFRLEDAFNDESPEKQLRPLDRKLFEALSLPYIFIDKRAAEAFLNGSFFNGKGFSTDKRGSYLGVFEEGALPDRLLGTLEYRDGKWGYGHVFRDN